VKEVDDPTTPIGTFGGNSATTNNFSRLFTTTPTPQASHGSSGRSYSYRGSQTSPPSVSGDVFVADWFDGGQGRIR
jgi:hypothetical protein